MTHNLFSGVFTLVEVVFFEVEFFNTSLIRNVMKQKNNKNKKYYAKTQQQTTQYTLFEIYICDSGYFDGSLFLRLQNLLL